MGNKAILMSIQPQWVAKILNGEKTIEVRKKFSKDYVGWVYIYCTKKDELGRIRKLCHNDRFICGKDFNIKDFPKLLSGYNGKGKVVARFWCDDVDVLETEFYKEEPLYDEESVYQAVNRIRLEQLEFCDYDEDLCGRVELYTNEDYLNETEEKNNKFLQKCCLSGKELQKYFNRIDRGYAIHISKLEVFDKPKELKSFKHRKFYRKCEECPYGNPCMTCFSCEEVVNLEKAPQNWCYVEG